MTSHRAVASNLIRDAMLAKSYVSQEEGGGRSQQAAPSIGCAWSCPCMVAEIILRAALAAA